MTVAGVIWLVFGSILILRSLGNVNGAVQALSTTDGVFEGIARLAIILFAAVFVHVGVQSIRGTARGTIQNGVGSIIFAAWIGNSSFFLADTRDSEATVRLVAGAGLLVAGILAFVAHGDYKKWRKAHKDRKDRGERAETALVR
jgi:hypothetical protein